MHFLKLTLKTYNINYKLKNILIKIAFYIYYKYYKLILILITIYNTFAIF
jgi:hypothetical protein